MGKQKNGEEEVVAGEGGEEGELSLMSWLKEYEDNVDATADILKGQISLIKKSKIDRNIEVLTTEKKPEVVRIAKNIVISFQDAIAKTVRDLNVLGVKMVDELQSRYSLPNDWTSAESVMGASVAGSDIFGPTLSSSRRRDIERLISLPPINGFPDPPPDFDINGTENNLLDPFNGNRTRPSTNVTEASKMSNSNLETENRNDESNCDVVFASSEDEDIGEETDRSQIAGTLPEKDRAPSPKIDVSKVEKLNIKQEKISEDSLAASSKLTAADNEKTPRKKSKDSSSASRETSKTPSTNKKIPKPSTENSDNDVDSDGSGKTCVVPSRVNKLRLSRIKKELVEKKKELTETPEEIVSHKNKEVSSNGSERSDDTHDLNTTESISIASTEVTEKPESSLIDPKSPQVNETNDDDSFMDFLPPPSPPRNEEEEMDFEDDSATVIMPRSHKSSSIAAIKQEKIESSKLASVPANINTSGVNQSPPDEPVEPKLEDLMQKNDAPEVEDISKPKDEIKKTRTDLKQSKEEREAMKDVLGSSSSEECETPTASSSRRSLSRGRPKKDLNELKKQQKERNAVTISPVAISKERLLEDLKLKEDAARVLIDQLDPAILKTLADTGYVKLENYRKLKKMSSKDLEKSEDEDSENSDANSSDELRRLVNRLTKSSILQTKKHDKKFSKTKRSQRKSRKGDRKSGGLDSNDSDSETDFEQRHPKSGGQTGTVDILSDSGSEDLLNLSSEDENKKKSQSKAKSNATTGKKYKQYKAAVLSSDESGREGMKDVLGSDSSDTDVPKRRSRRIKKEDGSDSDSDFKSRKSKPQKKKLTKKSDSDNSLIELSSGSDSDGSDFKSTKKRRRGRDSSPETGKGKKKRRRIIEKNSSSSENDSDIQEVAQNSGDDASPSQNRRKNIRKIMKSRDLAKTTKEAEKDEEERRKRLTEKQKLFNGVHKAPESDKIERLILDVDPDTNEPLIEVDPSIVAHLKPHQAEGIKFMFNACFESVQMIKENKVPGGCILAHCMGLGKTLQTIAFIHTMLTTKLCGIETVLVICPLSTTNNWFKECKQWTSDAGKKLRIHNLFEMKGNGSSKMDHLKAWKRLGGVGILHYDVFRRLADPKGKDKKMKESLRKLIRETLLDEPGPDMVVCDEGHLLKNCKSMLSLAVNNIRTHRRIVLTGTPLQNNLVEYHTMMNFVKPNLLGSLKEFTNRFANPIKNGQHADSTDYDVRNMKKRSHVLHRKLEGCVQRFDYSILAPYLPPKYEYIINIKLSEKQEELYKYYLANVVASDPEAKRKGLLKYYAELAKVWSHPIALTMRRTKNDQDETEESEGSLKDFIDDGSSDEGEGGSSETGSASNESAPKKRKTRAQAANDPEPEGDTTTNGLDDIDGFSGKWWNAVFKTKAEMYDVTLSGKLVVLQEILKTCEAIGDKVLVFSQFLSSLDIIEEFLKDWDDEVVEQQKQDEKTQELTFPFTKSSEGRWRRDLEYFRIDGSTKVTDRHNNCEKFNKKTITKAKLFLISTKAGGLGINLYGANRVVIFDASWNPSQDMQSIFRVYRFGQDKPCYIYRLIAKGTMEEKILRRQITKLSLSSRVVDEQQIQRHFKFDDVNEMYRYDEEDPSTSDAVLAVPKDRLLADLLMSHRKLVRSYEEFDSLLENKPDEGLSKEEKEIAWAEYRLENERQKQRGFNNVSPGQEAETYVKVKNKLSANYPGATEEQLETATNNCLSVIEKIRRAMVNQNQLQTIEQQAIMLPYINPLKEWLAHAVSQGPNLVPPAGEDLLRPLPQQFYQQVPYLAPIIPNPYTFHQNGNMRPHRPPIVRRGPNFNAAMFQSNQYNNMPQIRNNFQNIAANTISNLRPNLGNPYDGITRNPNQ